MTTQEILDGVAKTQAGGEWPGIRGGLQNIQFRAKTGTAKDVENALFLNRRIDESILGLPPQSPAQYGDIEFHVRLLRGTKAPLVYEFAFHGQGLTTREMLTEDNRLVFSYDGQSAFFHQPSGTLTHGASDVFSGSGILLSYHQGLAGEQKQTVEAWRQGLIGIQTLWPDPRVLRQYCACQTHGRAGRGFCLGDQGGV